jgi:hypothetical protein
MTERVKIIETEDVELEASTVGGVANYSGGPITVSGDLDPKQTKKRNKSRKKNNALGDNNDDTFSKLENKNVEYILESMVLQNLTELIVEQNDPTEVMALFDNIVKVVGLSFNYARVFINDGLKLDDDTLKFGMKRAKAELSRITELVRHLDQLLIKVYHANKAMQKQTEKDLKVPDSHPMEMRTEIKEYKVGDKVKYESDRTKRIRTATVKKVRSDGKLELSTGYIAHPDIIESKNRTENCVTDNKLKGNIKRKRRPPAKHIEVEVAPPHREKQVKALKKKV